MSDPVKNSEPNDVLTSIRRLVADGEVPEGASQSVSDDRLILTPALRVVEGVEEQPLVLGTVAKARFLPEQKGYDAEAAASKIAKSAKLSPQTPEQALDMPSDIDSTASVKASEARETSDFTAKMEALETAVGSIEQEFEPDDPDHVQVVGVEPQSASWEDNVELDAKGTPKNADGESLEAEVKEKVVGDESVTAEDVAFVARHSKAQAASRDSVLDAMDEEALNELIVQIVRKELAGPVGERITRNVRKLVRREVNRALADKDVD